MRRWYTNNELPVDQKIFSKVIDENEQFDIIDFKFDTLGSLPKNIIDKITPLINGKTINTIDKHKINGELDEPTPYQLIIYKDDKMIK